MISGKFSATAAIAKTDNAMYNMNKSPLDKDERREENKKRARKMVLIMGICCIVFILAMIVEVYL